MGFEENRSGVAGWFKIRRYSVEKLLYILHRITGLGIIVFVLIHMLYTGWRPGGWGDVVLGVLVVFHTVNGVRLIFVEYGFLVGKPQRAVYPYKMTTLSGAQRAAVILVLIVCLIILYYWSMIALGLMRW